MSDGVVTATLLKQIRAQFRLDWNGVHGAPHWARVRRHGLYLARQMLADARVTQLFAFLHDSQRANDHTDPAHGDRAADYALALRQQQALVLKTTPWTCWCRPAAGTATATSKPT